MGRSNYAIIAMGFVSTVVLSVLMNYFLEAADQRTRSPIGQELTMAFGERLDRPGDVTIDKLEDGSRRVVVTVYPTLGAGHDRLAREIGEYVWRRLAAEVRVAGVEVVCELWGREEPVRYQVPRPVVGMPPPPSPGH